MHTKDMTLSFTLEKESTWAVLIGEDGERQSQDGEGDQSGEPAEGPSGGL